MANENIPNGISLSDEALGSVVGGLKLNQMCISQIETLKYEYSERWLASGTDEDLCLMQQLTAFVEVIRRNQSSDDFVRQWNGTFTDGALKDTVKGILIAGGVDPADFPMRRPS